MDDIVLNLVMIAIFLGIAFPVHEFAHAWVAYLRGDATAKLFGRMTLNPIVHFDPVGGLMTIVSIFVGGVPVRLGEADAGQHRSTCKDRRNDEVLVALAGPASNLVMAILGAIVIRIVVATGISLPGIAAQRARAVRRIQRRARRCST